LETIFVYGTLRKGFPNHVLLMDSEFVGEDSITAKDISASGYFGVIPGNDVVKGEVYNCNSLTMQRIDVLECIEWDIYRKELVTTHAGREVYVYFANRWRA
jgi:gamma-glutamylaminecyclotransferase